MPVIKPGQQDRPDMPQISAWGLFGGGKKGGTLVELHFHDCDEWWVFTRGRALVRSEGVEYEVTGSDMVYTAMGDEHEVIEVHEDLEGVWFEGPHQGRKRRGHLHHPEDD